MHDASTEPREFRLHAIVVAIDAKLQDGRFAVYSRSGKAGTSRDAVEWAREATDRGAGEILLTSIDRGRAEQFVDLVRRLQKAERGLVAAAVAALATRAPVTPPRTP